MWSKHFHQQYGMCFTLDITKVTNYSLIPYDYKPVLRVVLTNKDVWNWLLVMIHAEDDLPDAFLMQPAVYVGKVKVSLTIC